MKIQTAAVLGLGAIGCTMAPGICEALGAQNFRVIASGARREALERQGRRINGKTWHFQVSEPEEKHEEDLILVAVKAGQLQQAVQDIRNHVGEHTVILSLMNGVSSEEVFGQAYGKEKVLYSLTTISSRMTGAEARYSLEAGVVKFGEAGNKQRSERVQAVAELFAAAGIPYEVPENMILALWQKFLFNVSNNTVSAVLHARHFYFQRLDAANRAREMVLREAQKVALAKKIPVTEEIIQACMEYGDGYPPDGYCSMVQDIEAGRHTEKDIFLGDLIRMAEEEQVEVPLCRFLWELLQAMEDAADRGRMEHRSRICHDREGGSV